MISGAVRGGRDVDNELQLSKVAKRAFSSHFLDNSNVCAERHSLEEAPFGFAGSSPVTSSYLPPPHWAAGH